MKKTLPDFKQLNDRIIAEPSHEPKLVIETNLDPQQATEENPYAEGAQRVSKTFEAFFQGDES
ncbi:hypothetical protein [Thermaerobacillus caldiproteolyticus]|uniref:Uncharacterized protein n=1 Tax=Thermaerobacillus caldiproteolyticus TaxID=247480 RepID=A0A7V9Z6P4_9BACL|nr:hypothetical protein [Anoxybacillus caldiproteolyticus]MBA2875082.1 hypothetical protein [Anoxybacillus caldiproteolyticus]QPA32941.1 hypothetical protein ISX45_08755 [Anoxybacillus caldiproteolyticus]